MLIRAVVQAALCVLVLSGGAVAQTTSVSFGGVKGDPTLPVEVNSDTLEINQTDGTALFSGDAVVTQGTMRLTSALVLASYTEAKKTIDTITATGDVLLVSVTDEVEADKAVYTVATGIVVLTGNVLMTQGAATIAGSRMVVDLTTGTGQMEGRVTATFMPGKK